MKIFLADYIMQRCKQFADECCKTHQQIEFGEHDTCRRSFKEISRDIIIGKMAECAFSVFARKRFELFFNLDFEIYPRGQWDNADVEVRNWRIDIKSSRQGAKWLLVDLNKIKFRTEENKLPHVFVMAVTGWDRVKDAPLNFVDLKGYSYLSEMSDNVDNTLMLKKGECIPNTRIPLMTDNYARNERFLNQNWQELFNKLRNENPV